MPDDVRPASWQDLITAEATKQGVDPRLAIAVADTESAFNPGAKSPVGALGLFQLMPATAKRRGVDPLDPVQNIRGGVGELKDLLDQHQGDVVTALRRYNASPGADPSLTDPYVQKVLGKLKPATTGATGGAAGSAPGQPDQQGGELGQPPPKPPESWGQWAYRHGANLLSSFDPRTTEGRRNLAGGAGAALGTVAVVGTAPVSAPVLGLSAATAGVLGAIGSGMTAEAGEQLVGTKPPSSLSVAGAGAQQGLYEAGGQLALWPLRAIGRRLIATKVGRYAAEGLSRQKAALSAQLDSALASAKSLLQSTKTSARQTVTRAAEGARTGVEAAGRAAESGVSRAEAQAAAGVSAAERGAAAGTSAIETRGYGPLVGSPPPSPAIAGRAANEVIQEGGAARARDLLGQAVDRAAESGPEVDITALKQEAQKLLERELQPPAQTFPREAPPPAAGAAAEEAPALAGGVSGPPRPLDQMLDAVAEAQAAAGQETLRHPAMGVLSRILNAADRVPFKDAHLFKKELDEAIGTTWDQSVKKKVINLTKVMRGSLRSALAVHEPYNAATRAYAEIAPLYGTKLVTQLRKAAVESPELLVQRLNPKNPTTASMLHDVLVNQSAAGGDAAGGQRAWDLVRSAWTHEKLTKGGLDTLGKRLDAVEGQPEFQRLLFGDQSGKTIWENLRAISSAYHTAVETGERAVAGAKEAGAAGVEAAREIGKQGVSTARNAGRQAVQAVRERGYQRVESAQANVEAARTARKVGLQPIKEREHQLASSSIARAARSGEVGETAGDVLRALMLGPQTRWGAISLAHLMQGPTASELVHWAALSPGGTRKLVTALTSPAYAVAVADLARSTGLFGVPEIADRMITGKKRPAKQGKAPAGGPPPSRRPPEVYATSPGVGTPPPAPPR